MTMLNLKLELFINDELFMTREFQGEPTVEAKVKIAINELATISSQDIPEAPDTIMVGVID